MTDSTTKPAYDSPPPNPQITFGDHLTDPEQREAVERSVTTLVARSAEAAAKARAEEAERAKLAAALDAPLIKLIEEDPAASKALEELRTSRHLIDSTYELEDQEEQPLPATNDVITVPVREARAAIRVPPYDFSWFWHNPDGSPPFSRMLIDSTARVGLDARSGFIDGGASGFVEAHAGFGLVLRTHLSLGERVTGRSFRRMQYALQLRAAGIGANATSEGGMELTALRVDADPLILLNSASAKMWRRRVSSSLFDPVESANEQEGPFAVYEPSELSFRMRAGHVYTFNVGIWVFTDRTTGVGTGAAESQLQGNVLAMTLERIPIILP